MCGHANLNRARPLVHHFVDAHLEHFVGVQRAIAEHNSVIKVVCRTVQDQKEIINEMLHFY